MITPEIKLAAENRGDRCPQCMPLGVALPARYVIDEPADSLTCWYVCVACGYRWFTSWWLAGLAAA